MSDSLQSHGTLVHYLWEYKLIQPQWKTIWNFFKKITNSYYMISYLNKAEIKKKKKNYLGKQQILPLFEETKKF